MSPGGAEDGGSANEHFPDVAGHARKGNNSAVQDARPRVCFEEIAVDCSASGEMLFSFFNKIKD
jgi:hypothetical protein